MKNSIYSQSNPNYKENILNLILSKNKNVKMLDAHIVRKSGKSRMIVFMIDENNHKFEKPLDKIKYDKYLCCKKCARKFFDEERYKKREKDWIDKLNQCDYKILNISEHITTSSIIDVEDKEGYRYEANARSVKNNQKLLRFSKCSNKKYLIYNLNIYKEKNNLNSEPIDIINENYYSHIKCKFKCKCGKYFIRSINEWMDGKDLCCECSQIDSSYERLVKQYLNENKIEYISEFTINECRKINPLPFDFLLKDFNCLIEIDGQQHFMPVDYGEGIEIAQKRFLQQQENDKIKNDYCKKFNIPLLRISYKDFLNNNWITLLENFINSLRSNDS